MADVQRRRYGSEHGSLPARVGPVGRRKSAGSRTCASSCHREPVRRGRSSIRLPRSVVSERQPPPTPVTHRSFELEADSDVRLDSLVAQRLELSRTQAATLIATGHVLVAGRREKASYRAQAGERVDVEIPAPPGRELVGESIPLDIVHEDEDLLVVDKA